MNSGYLCLGIFFLHVVQKLQKECHLWGMALAFASADSRDVQRINILKQTIALLDEAACRVSLAHGAPRFASIVSPRRVRRVH